GRSPVLRRKNRPSRDGQGAPARTVRLPLLRPWCGPLTALSPRANFQPPVVHQRNNDGPKLRRRGRMTQPGNRRGGPARLAAPLAAGVALPLSLTACGSSGDNSSSSGSSGGSSGQSANLDAAKAAVTEAEKEPTTIGSAPFGKFSPKPGGSIYLISCDLSIVG